jgi:hypothetical protein
MFSLLSWLSIADWLDIIGLTMVTLGVLGEVALGIIKTEVAQEYLFKLERSKNVPPEKPLIWLKNILTFPYNPTDFPPLNLANTWVEITLDGLIFLGLVLELIALPISLYQSHAEIEGLINKNLELQLKLQPRTIRAQQVTNFIFLTKNIPKFPVRIGIEASYDEPMNYAWQIKKMLNDARFPIPDSDTNFPFQIFNAENGVTISPVIGDTNEWQDLDFVSDNTNSFRVFSYTKVEHKNGLDQYTISSGDTNDIYGAFINAFIQDKMTVIWTYKPEWVSPNHCAIFILQKPQ